MSTLDHTWEILDDVGQPVFAVELAIDYTISPVLAAVTSGPAERCHPEEGAECDIEDVRPINLKKRVNHRWFAAATVGYYASEALAHLFIQQHDVEQLCRDHAEAEFEGHVEAGR